MKGLLLLLAIFGAVSAQPGPGNLNSFVEIRDALLRGEEVQLNANSEDCQVEGNLVDPILISMPMRHWQIITPEEGQQRIRADDFYIGAPSTESFTLLVRNLLLSDDDTAVLTLSVNDNLIDPLILSCEIGVGAIAHPLIPGNDLQEIDEYNEVKSLLLLGDHVEAIGDLGQCDNADEVLPAGIGYVVGYQIQLFSVIDDGTPDEFISINDVATLAFNGTDLSFSAEQLLVFPDGSVEVTIAILDGGDLSQIRNLTLNCQIGTSLRFTIHSREEEDTFTNFGDIKEATLAGHDMEVILFLEFCETLEGEPVDYTGDIGAARFDQFQWFPSGSMAGNELEYIAFSTYGLTVFGDILIDVIRVSEDNIVTLEYAVITAGSTAETNNHLLSCPLEEAALFHAVSRNRAPVQNYQQLIGDVIERGDTYEVEVNFALCDVPLDSIYGGVVWETYINTNPTSGFFYGSIFSVVQQNVTGVVGPAWDAADLLVNPDETVLITARLYDLFTGENLFPDAPADPIVCSMGGGEEAAVKFFRYP